VPWPRKAGIIGWVIMGPTQGGFVLCPPKTAIGESMLVAGALPLRTGVDCGTTSSAEPSAPCGDERASSARGRCG
jgi:hypothetical protein